jgi:zinc/manganese transport system substrate-binding protein
MRTIVFGAVFATLGAISAAHADLKVFACEPEWRALAIEIGGEHVSVYTATTGSQDPHQIQARPSLIAKARAADIAVCTGAELEIGWLPMIAQQSANASLQPGAEGYFEASSFIELLEKPVRLDRAEGDIHVPGNPHIQGDPHNMLIVASALADRFSSLDAANAAFYASRLADFTPRWQAAIAGWEAKAAPLEGVAIAVQHLSWIYLEKWLGLDRVVALEPKPGIPPSSGYLAQVVATLQQTPVRMVVRAAYESDRPSAFISERAQIPAVVLPFTVGGTEEATDLFGLYDDTISRLLAALEG